jgi:hypothetical protein
MGLFDSYFDPQTFSDEGGLLGRLRSLQQEQGQYQPGAGFDQTSSVPQTLSFADNGQASPIPQTPDYGQTQNIGIGGYQMPQFGRADIPQPLQPPPDLGDRLSSGFQSWAHTPVGSPMAALANGITGFGSGQRTDQAGVAPSQTPSPAPDLGDRLSAGFQNWAHTPVGNPMAAIANGITGLGSGQRIADPGTAPQAPQAQAAAAKASLDDKEAMAAPVNSQPGNPAIAQGLARQSAAASRKPISYLAPMAGTIRGDAVVNGLRKTRTNIPWSVR